MTNCTKCQRHGILESLSSERRVFCSLYFFRSKQKQEESDVSAVALEPPLCAVGVAQGIEAQAQARSAAERSAVSVTLRSFHCEAARAVLERKKETTETGCQVEAPTRAKHVASRFSLSRSLSLSPIPAQVEVSMQAQAPWPGFFRQWSLNPTICRPRRHRWS